MTEVFDLTIIGGGPSGLFAAYYAGLRHLKVKIIESLNQVGGQLTLLYPEKEIKDLAGFPEIKAADFITRLTQQLEQVEVTYCLNEKVTALSKNAHDLFEITTEITQHLSKAVIITTGGGAFVPRKLTCAGAEALENQKIFYQVKDSKIFSQQEVAILGGGDSAVDWALHLQKTAKKVYLLHRRKQFRALEHSLACLKQSSVEVLTPYVLEDLTENKRLALKLRQVKTKEEKILNVDQLLVSYGFLTNHDNLLPEISTAEGKILVNSACESNLPGLFACGDGAFYPGKVQLIATGLGEAPTAVNNAFIYLYPDSRLQPVHSTSL